MTFTDRIVLEIDAFGTTGVFEFKEEFDTTRQGEKSFLATQRGQRVAAVIDGARELLDNEQGRTELSRRRGVSVDDGSGRDQVDLSFEWHPASDAMWGSPTDDSLNGSGEDPLVARQILASFVTQARTDSQGQARLHIGEFSDGTYGPSGAFDRPMTVAVRDWNLDVDYSRTEDVPGSIDGSLTLSRVSKVDNPLDTLSDAADRAKDWFDDAI